MRGKGSKDHSRKWFYQAICFCSQRCFLLEVASFFEIAIAMAFEYFAQQKVDIAIIETGLGGRLDSTNIILPELSVITNIGLDHTQFLGDTLDKIAFEKSKAISDKCTEIAELKSKVTYLKGIRCYNFTC